MAIYEGRVAIDCDNAAIDLKKVIHDHLKKQGVPVTDLDYLGREKAGYPEIAVPCSKLRRLVHASFQKKD